MQNQSDTLSQNFTMTWIFPKKVAHYEDLFTVDLKEWVDDWKVRLLLRKVGSTEHDWYSNYILPKHSRDYNFSETVEI